MMKVCKIYCTYFGERRGVQSASPANAVEALEIFKKNIENDLTLDCGVDNMDIIIMNNNSKTITQECVDYLNKLNESQTPFGKIYVVHRPNIAGSLGAYSQAFDMFGSNYEYWFFIEDDIKMIYSRYYEMMINEFIDDDKLGFLALTKINEAHDLNLKHVSGGFGCSKREILKKVKERYGKLPYDQQLVITNYGGFGFSEQYFTNCFIKLGYEIKIPKNNEVIPLADNWKQFPPHVLWQNEKNFDLNKKFLYHIGI